VSGGGQVITTTFENSAEKDEVTTKEPEEIVEPQPTVEE